MKPILTRCFSLSITLIACATAQTIQDGLVAYYDFEETGQAGITNKAPGTNQFHGAYISDISLIAGTGAGFSGDATYPGAVLTNTTDRAQMLVGNALNVAKADSTTRGGRGHFTVPSLGSSVLGGDFTISAWFYLAQDADNTSTTGNVIRNFVFESTNNFHVSWGTGANDNTYTPYLGAGSGAGPTSVLEPNQWHHVVHSFADDGVESTLNVYINGTLVTTMVNNTGAVNFVGLNFGSNRDGERIFDGMIDEVAVWNRTMDADEVAAVHSLGAAGLPLLPMEGGEFLYWDTNGAAAGAGGESPSGSWGDANWSIDSAGESVTASWLDGSTALFSAGDDATGSFTVALDGIREAGEVRVRNGDVSLQGGTLELADPAVLRVLGSNALTVSSALSAPRLMAYGDITLQSVATVAGPLTAMGGTLALEDGSSFGGLMGSSMLDLGSGTLTLNTPVATRTSFSGSLSGNGVIVKSGEGAQTFNRTDDGFSGGFTVEDGTLVLAGEKAHLGATVATGGVLVADGSIMGELNVGPDAALSIGSTLGGTSRATLELDAFENTIDGNLIIDLNPNNTTPGAGVNDLLVVRENIAFGPTSTITPRFSGGLPDPAAIYEVVWVDGFRNGIPAIDPAFQASTRYEFETQPGTFGSDIQLAIIGGAPESLTWAGDGVENIWDAGGVENWRIGATPSQFFIPDHVEFNDAGDNSTPIEIRGEILPSSILVDAEVKDYVWAGDGVIGGTTGLEKSGAAELTLLNRNEFTGETRVFGGGITVGDGGTSGTPGAGPITLDAGTALTINRSGTLPLSSEISGEGAFVQKGPGTTVFYSIMTYTGGTTVTDGTLVVANYQTGGLGGIRGPVVVEPGAALEYGDIRAFGFGDGISVTSLTINEGRVGGDFFNYFWNSGSEFPIEMTSGTLDLGGTTHENQFLSPVFTVNAATVPSVIKRVDGNTSATLRLRNESSMVVNAEAGATLEIHAPISSTDAFSSTAANLSGGLTLIGEGTLVLTGASTYGGVTTINGGTLKIGNGGQSGSLGSGPVVNHASIEINRSNTQTFSNAMSGAGSLTVKGGGVIRFAGVSTASGNTVVEDGTLVLDAPGQLAFVLDGSSSNTISGPGSAEFNGTFHLDLSAADSYDGNSWTLATVATQSFGSTFAVNSNAGPFLKSGSIHTLVANDRTWTFDQASATLSVKADIVLANGASLKLIDGTEASDNNINLAGGIIWLGDAVEVANDIELTGPAAQNLLGGALAIDYLVVGGGGGGGGRDASGGGGGGGVISNLFTSGLNALPVVPEQAFTLFVGQGGAGGTSTVNGGADGQGTNGESSSFGSMIALGGGGGGAFNTPGKAGASGGGGGRQPSGAGGGAGTPGQGFAGGSGSGGTNTGANTSDAGAGGGGAGSQGSDGIAGADSGGGRGGNGLATSIITTGLAADLGIGEVVGNQVYFGGGGGGTPHRNGVNVPSGGGGFGGGAAGPASSDDFAIAGATNTGGGGGASRSNNAARGTGGQGGSGVVLVRYPGSPIATGGDEIRTENGFTYHVFTSSGSGAMDFGTFTGDASATIEGTISGSGGLTWRSTGTLTLAAANTYSGDTVVDSGTLVFVQATLADASSVFLTNGATLDLAHGTTDTIGGFWINGVQQPAGTYHAGNTSSITGTGSLLVTDGAGVPTGFAGWIGGFFPGETNPAIVGPHADANGDGVANALVYLFGGDPKDGNNLALLPTSTLATNPGGSVPNGEYLVITYRRDASAIANASVEYSTTLEAPWTTAMHGVGGVVVVETANGFAAGIDRVEVFIPRQASPSLFGRASVEIP